jgi:hypothetical protein
MRKEIRYIFSGTEKDARKFVDPEPRRGVEYTCEQIEKFIDDNNQNIPVGQFFTVIEVQVPEPIQEAKDVLTPMMRIEVLKIEATSNRLTLKQIERYIAFGEYPQ